MQLITMNSKTKAAYIIAASVIGSIFLFMIVIGFTCFLYPRVIVEMLPWVMIAVLGVIMYVGLTIALKPFAEDLLSYLLKE